MRGHVCLATPPGCGSSGGFAPVTDSYKAVTNCYKKNGTNHFTHVKPSGIMLFMGSAKGATGDRGDGNDQIILPTYGYLLTGLFFW